MNRFCWYRNPPLSSAAQGAGFWQFGALAGLISASRLGPASQVIAFLRGPARCCPRGSCRSWSKIHAQGNLPSAARLGPHIPEQAPDLASCHWVRSGLCIWSAFNFVGHVLPPAFTKKWPRRPGVFSMLEFRLRLGQRPARRHFYIKTGFSRRSLD